MNVKNVRPSAKKRGFMQKLTGGWGKETIMFQRNFNDNLGCRERIVGERPVPVQAEMGARNDYRK